MLQVDTRPPSIAQPSADISLKFLRLSKLHFNWFLISFLAPACTLVVLISIYPVIDAIVLSTFRTRYAIKEQFVGFANYIELLRDPSLWKAAFNSAVFTGGSLALVLPVAFAIALLLNSEVPFRSFVRAVVILPWVVSQTIVALLWAWLLNADFGPLTYLAEAVIGQRLTMLAAPNQAMASLIVVNVWASYPQAALLLLAALQTIPKDLYESAKIDGASPLKTFRYVTLPLIRPTLLVVLIQLTLLYFNMVTLIYVFTGGGPLQGTETLALRVLKVSFESWNLGQGAALGLLITIVNFVCSLLYVRILRSRNDAR
jgi:multiple sugar transport system permease protein